MEMHGDAAVTMETKQVDTTEQIDKRTESDSTQSSSVQNSVSMATNEGDHSGGENEAPTVPRDDKYSIPLPPLRCTTPISPSPLDDTTMRWVSEAMKVVFNQTVHWKEEKDFTKVSDFLKYHTLHSGRPETYHTLHSGRPETYHTLWSG